MENRALEVAEWDRVLRSMIDELPERREQSHPNPDGEEVRLVQRHLPFDLLDPDNDGDDHYEDDDSDIDDNDEDDDDDDDEPDDLPPLVRLNDLDDPLGFGDFFFLGGLRYRGFGGGLFDFFGDLIQQRNQEMMTSRMEVYLKQVRNQDPCLESVDMTLSHPLCVTLIHAMQKSNVINTLSVDLNDGSAPHILDELLKLLEVNRKLRRLELGDFEQLTSITRFLERIVAETKKTKFHPHFTELVIRLFVPAASEQPTKASVLRLFDLLAQLPNVISLELEVDLADILVTQVSDEFIQMVKQSENLMVVKLDGTEEDHKEGCLQLEDEARKICRFRQPKEREDLLKKMSHGSLSLWPNIISKLTEQDNYSTAFWIMREMNGNLVSASS